MKKDVKNGLNLKKIDKVDKRILQFFASLSDETRLKILLTLKEKPRNVNEIYENVRKGSLTLSAISHQLRQLNNLGIVEFVKTGREKKFRLSDNFCWCILNDALKHFSEKDVGGCKSCSDIKNKNLEDSH